MSDGKLHWAYRDNGKWIIEKSLHLGIRVNDTFSNCCGARFKGVLTPESKKFNRNSNYICLGIGEAAEKDTGKHAVNVVQTKNGPLTVGVRYEW